ARFRRHRPYLLDGNGTERYVLRQRADDVLSGSVVLARRRGWRLRGWRRRGCLVLPRHHIQRFADRASATSVRTATPVGPFGCHGFASSAHAVPAMSRCAQGVSPVKALRKSAALMAPP